MTTSETAIKTFGFSQLYMALGEPDASGGSAVRIYWKPGVTLIWLGALVMGIGGLLSLTDRRLRVGAPARTGKPARTAALPVAAE